MGISFKENQILLMVSVVIGMYDLLTIKFHQLLITLTFAVVLYGFTHSLFLFTLVLVVPQFIKMINFVMKGSKESMANPTEINTLITGMKTKYSQGVPEIVQESFTDALEISNRIEHLKKVPQVKEEVSGEIDASLESGPYPIEGNPSYPKFDETKIGTSLDSVTGIYTIAETSIPATGTLDKQPKQNPYVPKFDELGLNTALSQASIPISANASNVIGV